MYHVRIYTVTGGHTVESKEFCGLTEIFEYLRTQGLIQFVYIRRIGNV